MKREERNKEDFKERNSINLNFLPYYITTTCVAFHV